MENTILTPEKLGEALKDLKNFEDIKVYLARFVTDQTKWQKVQEEEQKRFRNILESSRRSDKISLSNQITENVKGISSTVKDEVKGISDKVKEDVALALKPYQIIRNVFLWLMFFLGILGCVLGFVGYGKSEKLADIQTAQRTEYLTRQIDSLRAVNEMQTKSIDWVRSGEANKAIDDLKEKYQELYKKTLDVISNENEKMYYYQPNHARETLKNRYGWWWLVTGLGVSDNKP